MGRQPKNLGQKICICFLQRALVLIEASIELFARQKVLLYSQILQSRDDRAEKGLLEAELRSTRDLASSSTKAPLQPTSAQYSAHTPLIRSYTLIYLVQPHWIACSSDSYASCSALHAHAAHGPAMWNLSQQLLAFSIISARATIHITNIYVANKSPCPAPGSDAAGRGALPAVY